MRKFLRNVCIYALSLTLLVGGFGGTVGATEKVSELDQSLKKMGFAKELIAELDADEKADLVKTGGTYSGHSVIYLEVYKNADQKTVSREISKQEALELVGKIKKEKEISAEATISTSVLKLTSGATKLSLSTDSKVRYKFYGNFQWLSDPINRWEDPFVVSTQTVWSAEPGSSTGWYKYDRYTYPNIFRETITDNRLSNYDDTGSGFFAYYFDLQASLIADESYRNHRGYVSWIGNQVNHKNSSDYGNVWASYFHETLTPAFSVDVSGSGGSISISPSYAFDKQVVYSQFLYNH